MISVFERSGQVPKNRRIEPSAFLLAESCGVLKGASLMWLTRILPIDRNHSRRNTEPAAAGILSVEEATRQRDAAIKNMTAAIAEHDFVNARRYSNEEVRLTRAIETSQSDALAREPKLA
jgi:hypothetical protein